jgi:hypothetical protein
MPVKFLLFPLTLAKLCAGAALSLVRFAFSLVSGIFRFGFDRIFGAIFGASVGAVGGRRHVGVKWFPRKR